MRSVTPRVFLLPAALLEVLELIRQTLESVTNRNPAAVAAGSLQNQEVKTGWR